MNGVRTESWILEKVFKFAQQFSRPGKSLENEIKSGKNESELQQVLYNVIFFFVLFKSRSVSPVCLQRSMKKAALFLCFLKSLLIAYLITLNLEKEYWIQKSVQTLNKLRNLLRAYAKIKLRHHFVCKQCSSSLLWHYCFTWERWLWSVQKGCNHSVRFCRPNGPMKLNLFTVSFGFRTRRLFQDYIPNSKWIRILTLWILFHFFVAWAVAKKLGRGII